jgi:hypothetical protein
VPAAPADERLLRQAAAPSIDDALATVYRVAMYG